MKGTDREKTRGIVKAGNLNEMVSADFYSPKRPQFLEHSISSFVRWQDHLGQGCVQKDYKQVFNDHDQSLVYSNLSMFQVPTGCELNSNECVKTRGEAFSGDPLLGNILHAPNPCLGSNILSNVFFDNARDLTTVNSGSRVNEQREITPAVKTQQAKMSISKAICCKEKSKRNKQNFVLRNKLNCSSVGRKYRKRSDSVPIVSSKTNKTAKRNTEGKENTFKSTKDVPRSPSKALFTGSKICVKDVVDKGSAWAVRNSKPKSVYKIVPSVGTNHDLVEKKSASTLSDRLGMLVKDEKSLLDFVTCCKREVDEKEAEVRELKKRLSAAVNENTKCASALKVKARESLDEAKNAAVLANNYQARFQMRLEEVLSKVALERAKLLAEKDNLLIQVRSSECLVKKSQEDLAKVENELRECYINMEETSAKNCFSEGEYHVLDSKIKLLESENISLSMENKKLELELGSDEKLREKLNTKYLDASQRNLELSQKLAAVEPALNKLRNDHALLLKEKLSAGMALEKANSERDSVKTLVNEHKEALLKAKLGRNAAEAELRKNQAFLKSKKDKSSLEIGSKLAKTKKCCTGVKERLKQANARVAQTAERIAKEEVIRKIAEEKWKSCQALLDDAVESNRKLLATCQKKDVEILTLKGEVDDIKSKKEALKKIIDIPSALSQNQRLMEELHSFTMN